MLPRRKDYIIKGIFEIFMVWYGQQSYSYRVRGHKPMEPKK